MADRNLASREQAVVAGRHVRLPTASLRPNTWNYNRQSEGVFAKLVAAIRRHGFTKPVVVRSVRGVPGHEVVDGEHRWRAAVSLGIPEVPVIDLGPISDERARELTVVMNELAGQADEARLGELLRATAAEATAAELAAVMPFSAPEMGAYLELSRYGFASLPEADPAPELRAPAKAEMTFEGAEAREVRALSRALGMSPRDAVLVALRARKGH